MYTIYCIEDCNSLKYVGSTKQTLKKRLAGHRCNKKKNNTCSSRNLDLKNCKIYSLESCNESNRKERERYWINHIDCVNQLKLNYNHNEYHVNWRKKNKMYHRKYTKEQNLFRSKKVVIGCYEFIKMLEQY